MAEWNVNLSLNQGCNVGTTTLELTAVTAHYTGWQEVTTSLLWEDVLI